MTKLALAAVALVCAFVATHAADFNLENGPVRFVEQTTTYSEACQDNDFLSLAFITPQDVKTLQAVCKEPYVAWVASYNGIGGDGTALIVQPERVDDVRYDPELMHGAFCLVKQVDFFDDPVGALEGEWTQEQAKNVAEKRAENQQRILRASEELKKAEELVADENGFVVTTTTAPETKFVEQLAEKLKSEENEKQAHQAATLADKVAKHVREADVKMRMRQQLRTEVAKARLEERTQLVAIALARESLHKKMSEQNYKTVSLKSDAPSKFMEELQKKQEASKVEVAAHVADATRKAEADQKRYQEETAKAKHPADLPAENTIEYHNAALHADEEAKKLEAVAKANAAHEQLLGTLAVEEKRKADLSKQAQGNEEASKAKFANAATSS